MGLYQKICEHFINPQNSSTEKSMGLLAKAQEFLASNPIPHFSVNIDAPFVFFKNFAYEVGLQKVAVLIPVENQYQTIFSYGIESASREENISTLDFWNGTISTEDWYSLSGEDLSSFYQLFSENDIHNLKHIHIKKFLIDENNYAIILILEDTENSLIDLETAEIVLPNLKEYISSFINLVNEKILFPHKFDYVQLEEKVSKGLNEGSGFMYSISLKNIFKELSDSISFEDFYHIFSVVYYAIKISLKEFDVINFTDELEIRYVTFAQTETDLSTLNYNFNSLIKDCFTEIEQPELKITQIGCSTDLDEILDFFFSEN